MGLGETRLPSGLPCADWDGLLIKLDSFRLDLNINASIINSISLMRHILSSLYALVFGEVAHSRLLGVLAHSRRSTSTSVAALYLAKDR